MSHPAWIENHPQGIVLLVKVQPRSSKAGIGGEIGGRLKIKLSSPPIEGKANKELIELVAKRLKIAKSAVSLVKGEKGKEKSLLCKGISPQEAAELLGGG